MGAVGGLLGLNGGASGTGFASPQSANILNPTNVGQANNSYQGVLNSLNSQNALLQALQGQQGIQNQSNVYNQLQGVASGQGPNPAQAMLNQATGQNVANQAALMASQRGANANVGLLARQAAQQGANIQQQAVGQGASIQSQQALNALGMAGNLANIQANQQINQTNANAGAQQSEQQNLLNSIAQQNSANVGMQSNINSANAGLANSTMQGQQGLLGGVANNVGAAIGTLLAEGGEVHSGPRSHICRHLAHGGIVPAMVSPGEIYLTPHDVKEVKNGADPMKVGKVIPGNPKIGGAINSYKNDFVKKDLKEGGIIVPRSETKSKNPSKNSKDFVDAVLAKRKVK